MPIFDVATSIRLSMVVQADSHEEATRIAADALYDYVAEDAWPEPHSEVLGEIKALSQAPEDWDLTWPIHGRDDEKTLRDLLPAEEE